MDQDYPGAHQTNALHGESQASWLPEFCRRSRRALHTAVVSMVTLIAAFTPDFWWQLHSQTYLNTSSDVLQLLLLRRESQPTSAQGRLPLGLQEVELDAFKKPLLPVTVVKEGSALSNQVVVLSESRRQLSGATIVDQSSYDAGLTDAELISQWLAEAEAAFTLDRLMTPKEDNAFDRLQAVLALEPENSQALAGMERLRKRYLAIVNSAIRKQLFYMVPDFLHKARGLGVKDTTIDKLVASLPEKYRQPAADYLLQMAELEHTDDFDGEEGVSTDGAQHVASAETDGSDVSEIIPHTDLLHDDREMARVSTWLLQQGEMKNAEQQLMLFIQANPHAEQSWKVLFDHYLREQNWSAAGDLLTGATYLPDHLLAQYTATLLSFKGDHLGASRVLNIASPSQAESPEFYRVKATVLYQLGDYTRAAGIFQQLLASDATDMTCWLGLAMSLDALGDDRVLSLYQEVAYQSLGNEVYWPMIQNRISTLVKNAS